MLIYPPSRVPRRLDQVHPSRRCPKLAIAVLAVFSSQVTTNGNSAWADDRTDRSQRGMVREDGRSFEPLVAQDTLNYPPDSPLDVNHLHLTLQFDDLTSKRFGAEATYYVRPRTESVRFTRFDAIDLRLLDVSVFATDRETFDPLLPDQGPHKNLGAAVPLSETYYDGQALWLEFVAPLPIGKLTAITIRYECIDPAQGLIFALPEGGHAQRPLTIHSQGQTEFSRYWFPCLDSPVDRFTSSMSVTVPSGYEVVSNGRLIDKKFDAANQYATFHWMLNVTQPAYLVSLVIGEFDVIEDRWRSIPVNYYVPAGRRDDGHRTFQRTPEMMEHFSQLLGVDYPYAQYSQAAVFRFGADGMENTSATTYTDAILLDEASAKDQDEEELIAHELAHQWFGDLVTCRSWSDLWLNEGLSTFMEVMWVEKAQGRDDYLANILGKIEGLAESDASEKGVPMVFRDYRDPEDTFLVQGGLPYDKGCVVIHMLRQQLGDELLWKCLNQYLVRHREGLVDTNDFRKTIEEVSGRSYERFFQQWAFRPGVPEVHVSANWLPEPSLLEVTVEQKQVIIRERPAFEFPLELLIQGTSGSEKHTLQCSAKLNKFQIPLSEEPALYEFDPQCSLLAGLHISKPTSMWLKQVDQGSTVVTRIRAARRLGEESGDEALNALSLTLNDETLHYELRLAAAHSLSEMDSQASWHRLRSAMIGQPGIADSRVRAGVLGLLEEHIEDSEIAALMKNFAQNDPSVRVQAAALHGLGKVRDAESVEILREKADTSSHRDQIRHAAIESLANLGDRAGLAAVMKYAAHGNHDRLRPDALRALGRIGAHAQLADEVRDFLIPMLNDPEPEAASAAMYALTLIDDEESRRALEFKRNPTAHPDRRSELDGYINSLNGQPTAAGEVSELSERAAELREELDEMVERLYQLEQMIDSDVFAN